MRYETMEKAAAKAKDKYANLEKGWDTNPSNKIEYPTMQSEEVMAELERQTESLIAKRIEQHAKGEVPVSEIMYPTMIKFSVGEIEAAMAEEAKRLEIEVWNKAVRLADEMQEKENGKWN